MITNTMLANAPCRKSVTMTAICPPTNVKKSEIARSRNIISGNVDHVAPSHSNVVGKPHSAMKNRPPTAGKIPKLMIPARYEMIPANTRKFRL
jgi:hypothetical protein